MKLRGTVKFFNESKQYGFLQPDDAQGPDVFFGKTALPFECQIDKGCPVEYELGQDKQGRPRALSVRPVDA